VGGVAVLGLRRGDDPHDQRIHHRGTSHLQTERARKCRLTTRCSELASIGAAPCAHICVRGPLRNGHRARPLSAIVRWPGRHREGIECSDR
jgi:hypothetical protein